MKRFSLIILYSGVYVPWKQYATEADAHGAMRDLAAGTLREVFSGKYKIVSDERDSLFELFNF